MSESTLTALTWLIPAGPLLAFPLIVLLFNRNRTLSFLTAWAGIGTALVLSWIVAFSLITPFFTDGFKEAAHHLEEHPVAIHSAIEWLPFKDIGSYLKMGVSVDPLTAVMLIMVPFACMMIFIYSVGYHNYGQPRGTQRGVPNHGKEEPMFSRFFALISLFAGAMMTLVVADNLLLVFVGWEIMGMCSYLLIGFWYARTYPEDGDPDQLAPRYASIKAFMTTRTGDVIMLLGIVFFYRTFGTLNFSEALSADSLAHAAHAPNGLLNLGIMMALLFAGTVGKSAQFPLHVWLPNAMEGPTPVSAMIHAATMVSAGIYLVVRLFPLLAVAIETTWVSLLIAGIGAFTALMASTIALAQKDVKGVLAYSTISQLGFMVAALGIGAYIAAAFHLITHAFFKALLFLGSGSVIHGMEHGAEHVHDHHTDPQDMFNMGGLRKKMPITYWTFLAGGMALSGFPIITAGFWSKDEILADAWYQFGHNHIPAVSTMSLVVFVVLCLAAFLTAFYTMRQISLTFLGEPRTPLAEHAHESNGYMTFPLVMLAIFAIGIGWVGIPESFPVIGGILNYNFFHHFVGATIYDTMHHLADEHLVAHGIITLPFQIVPLMASIIVALGGLGLGYLTYGWRPLKAGEPDPLVSRLGGLYTFLERKWYWDVLYKKVIINPINYFSEEIVYNWIDKGAIDGTIHFVASTIFGLGAIAKRVEEAVFGDAVDGAKDWFLAMSKQVRTLQSGKIQEYVWTSVLMTALFIAFILFAVPAVFGG